MALKGAALAPSCSLKLLVVVLKIVFGGLG